MAENKSEPIILCQNRTIPRLTQCSISCGGQSITGHCMHRLSNGGLILALVAIFRDPVTNQTQTCSTPTLALWCLLVGHALVLLGWHL